MTAHTDRRTKFTLPGPMTIVDTVADRFYGDKVKMAFAFAEMLNQEALALQADGVDIIQFDEPAFNVYMKDAADWGVTALERAAQLDPSNETLRTLRIVASAMGLDWVHAISLLKS